MPWRPLKLLWGTVIVVDFGTTTTFCAINEKREYLGGVIFPGLEIAAEGAVFTGFETTTCQLGAAVAVIGKNTVNSIQSGLIYGYTEFGGWSIGGSLPRYAANRVIATGGFKVGSLHRIRADC